MSVTEQDYRQHQATRPVTPKPRITSDLLLKQAAVESKLLTGAPEWDTYLQRVQAMLEEHQRGVTVYQDAYNRSFDERSRNVAQLELYRHIAAVEVLQQLIAIPHELVKRAAESGLTTHPHA